jgi:D-inositol-3-phosphate glycosyltransferase
MAMFHTLGAVKNAVGVGEEEPELRIETEKCLVRSCHRIIAATGREKTDLIRHYGASPETISVIPCGVNLELFQPMDKVTVKQELGLDGGENILFVGRIEPLKGIDKLLMAMTYLKDKAKLLVIGGDENSHHEIERLQRLSQELGIEDSVIFLGRVKHEELPHFYNAADVCVIPSYYESFGLVMLESLACGTPVVATDVGGAMSVVRQGETGYVVKDNVPHRLAEKIALLLSRRNNGDGAASLIRASVAGFSWSNIARIVLRECQTLLVKYPN